VTVIVCEYAEVWAAEAWATADSAGKATAAETPATKQAVHAIRGMNRPARIIRILINAICMARLNIIRPTSVAFGAEDLQHQEVCAAEHAAKPRENCTRRAWCNLRKTVKSNYFGARDDGGRWHQSDNQNIGTGRLTRHQTARAIQLMRA
jgi:hypothetical protein